MNATQLLGLWRGDSPAQRAVRVAAMVLLAYALEERVFGLSLTYLVDGLVLGSLYGIVAVAVILIYRTTRTINFAAGALGAIPAIVALVLDAHFGLSYLWSLLIAALGGLAVGAAADLLVMRRFARSPRLIVGVVTIGLAQTLAIGAFFAPIWMGVRADLPPSVPTPWQHVQLLHNSRGQPILSGNQVAALVVVALLSGSLAAFLRWTRLGIAIRASAENADRAALLGIPAAAVGTVAWAIAGLLSAMAICVQAPLVGIPSDATLGFDTLLYGLAAAVVARMTGIGTALVAGMGVGVIVFGSVARTGDNNVASAIMLVVILAALLAQRRTSSRTDDAAASSWESIRQFRRIPSELRSLAEVRWVGRGAVAAVLALACAAPFVVAAPDLPALTFLPIYGMIAVSLVVLTGWAGQISLGQFGLVGAGALAAGGIIARNNPDFFVALGVGTLAGVVLAVVIGVPAIRLPGLYLSVTTLAFGYAMQGYLLNPQYPVGRWLLPKALTASIVRPQLYGRIDLEDGHAFYLVCLVLLALSYLAASSLRRHRTGRVLIAATDNPRAASAYGVNLIGMRLAAFAVSGGVAGMAGVLVVYLQHQVIADSFSVSASVAIFLAVIVGGVSSLGFAVSGAVLFEATTLFGPRLYQLLGQDVVSVLPLVLTGPLLILNLYFYRGGTAQWGFELRDRILTRLARRRAIHVPSLVEDSLAGAAVGQP